MYRNDLYDRCVRRLHGIEIPRPFRLDAFAATIAERRNRALHVVPLPGLDGSDGLSGAWVATDMADYVLIDADASPWHRDLIGLHEIGHLLCGHGAGDGGLGERAGELLPRLSDVTIRRILGRHGFGSLDEQEAELMACLILKQADADPPVGHLKWKRRRRRAVGSRTAVHRPPCLSLGRRLPPSASPGKP